MRRWTLARNRDFMLLWSGQALSLLGSQASTVAFPLLALALTHSPGDAGIVGLAKWLPLALTALPAGMLVDRLDRKRLMIACDGIRALLLASIPVALALGRPSFLQLALVAFADGALFTVTYICERGALRQVVDVEQLPDAVAQNEARGFAANLLGPPLGGLLFALGRSLPFLADACSYAASSAAVAATRADFQAPGSASRGRGWRGAWEGCAWLWRHAFFRDSALLFAFGNPLYTGLYLLAILLAKRDGASSAEVGAMFAIVGGGGVLGGVAASWLRRAVPVSLALVGEGWLVFGAMPLLLVVHSPLLIGVVVAIAELPTPFTNGLVSGHRVALTPDHLQGRVQAAGTLVTMSLAWAGPLAVGFLFQRAGQTATVLVVVGYALALAGATTLRPTLRQGPPSPAGEAERRDPLDGAPGPESAAGTSVR